MKFELYGRVLRLNFDSVDGLTRIRDGFMVGIPEVGIISCGEKITDVQPLLGQPERVVGSAPKGALHWIIAGARLVLEFRGNWIESIELASM